MESLSLSLSLSLSPPVPPSLYPDRDVDVNVAQGSSVTFQFQVSGQPEPTVVWEHESRRITSDRHMTISSSEGVTSLTVHRAGRREAGSYVCCAMNHLGNALQECQLTLLGEDVYDVIITS